MTQPPRRGGRTPYRLLARVLGVILTAGLGVFAVPAPAAQAHATLLFTSPAVDGAVPTSPKQVLLVFDQPVVTSRSPVTVTGPDGDTVPLGSATTNSQGHTISVPVTGTLEQGEYLVRWEATATDGDTMLGEFRFAVGSTAGLSLGGGGAAVTRGAPCSPGCAGPCSSAYG